MLITKTDEDVTKGHLHISDRKRRDQRFLKIKILNWNLWFSKEPLTTMETFHCTK